MKKLSFSHLTNDRIQNQSNPLELQISEEDLRQLNLSEDERDFIQNLIVNAAKQTVEDDQTVFDLSTRTITAFASLISDEEGIEKTLLIQYPKSLSLSKYIAGVFNGVLSVREEEKGSDGFLYLEFQ